MGSRKNMKHIKPFNESKDNFVDELKDFCETNLAYLIDEGLQVDIIDKGLYDGVRLNEIKITLKNSWVSIKDHMIPFLIRLRNNYKIIPYPGTKHNVLVYLTKPKVYNIQNSIKMDIRELIHDNEQLTDDITLNVFLLFIQKK